MEQLDKVILSLKMNIDTGIGNTPTPDGIDKLKKALQEYLDFLNNMETDLKEPRDQEDDTIFTIYEAAKRYGISPTTLYKHVNSGEIPSFRIGNKIRIKKKDIEKYRTFDRFNLIEDEPETPPSSYLLTVEEASEYSGLSTVIIYSMIKSGKLKTMRSKNGKFLINPDDIDQEPMPVIS